MQADGKREGISVGVAASLAGSGVDDFTASISTLHEIIEKVEANTPFSAIRQVYEAPLDTLVKLAGQDRDVNLLARLHAVMSILEAEDSTAGRKDILIAQVSQVEKMLQDRAARPKSEAKSIIAGQQTPTQDVARRVAELHVINEQLSADCDRVAAANNTLLMNIKNLKNQYSVVSEQYDQEVKNFKALQSRVVSARIESNRLSMEINFLKEEHQKLLDLVEEKHLLLDDLFRRLNGIRCSFEFVSGETGFAQDIITNVEGLLNKTLMQKKSLNDKIASSEESMEKLLSEFNEIVKKGKTEFYRSL